MEKELLFTCSTPNNILIVLLTERRSVGLAEGVIVILKKKWGLLMSIIVLLVFAHILVAAFFWLSYKTWTLQFTEIASYDTGRVLTSEETLVWFSLRHDDYQGFFSSDILKNLGVDAESMIFDFEQNTYVITIGHELRDIKYRYSTFKKRRFVILPKQAIGIVTLDGSLVNKVFVYRIRKMDIDCDYHDRRAYVTFS